LSFKCSEIKVKSSEKIILVKYSKSVLNYSTQVNVLLYTSAGLD